MVLTSALCSCVTRFTLLYASPIASARLEKVLGDAHGLCKGFDSMIEGLFW